MRQINANPMAGQPPQYNSTYDPRPPPGYNQGPGYPQGYGQPAYGQPGQYPMYMPVAAPPKKDNTVTIVVIVIVVVILLIVIIPMALSFMLVSQMQSMPQGGGSVSPVASISVSQTSSGNWTVSVMSVAGSSASTSSVYLVIVNSNTGAETVHSRLTSSSSDFQFNDNDANGRFTAGDTILLKGSSRIQSGYTLRLTYSDDTIASRTLP